MRYERDLNPTDILTSKMTAGAENHIFGNYGMALSDRKSLLRSRNVLVIINRFLGDLRGPWELPGLGEGHGDVLRSEPV